MPRRCTPLHAPLGCGTRRHASSRHRSKSCRCTPVRIGHGENGGTNNMNVVSTKQDEKPAPPTGARGFLFGSRGLALPAALVRAGLALAGLAKAKDLRHLT